SDYAAVRPRVEAALKLERARQLASKAASDLAFALYDQKVEPGAVEAFLAARNLSARELAPFSRNQPAPEVGGNPDAVEAAFRLGPQRHFSDALSTASGTLVLLWKASIPARQPLLIEVQARVRSDFVEAEKRKRFVELGRSLHEQLQTQLKAGASLETAAAAASGATLEVKAFPAFSRRQPPADLDYTVLGALEQLGPGKLSDMITTQEKGLFVYVVEKKL